MSLESYLMSFLSKEQNAALVIAQSIDHADELIQTSTWPTLFRCKRVLGLLRLHGWEHE